MAFNFSTSCSVTPTRSGPFRTCWKTHGATIRRYKRSMVSDLLDKSGLDFYVHGYLCLPDSSQRGNRNARNDWEIPNWNATLAHFARQTRTLTSSL
eukprot:6461701-Amphidinium_carterae.1